MVVVVVFFSFWLAGFLQYYLLEFSHVYIVLCLCCPLLFLHCTYVLFALSKFSWIACCLPVTSIFFV
ncbi:hypothetical protein DsansV1_C02g0015011 [Dioscorea sansibarensis]